MKKMAKLYRKHHLMKTTRLWVASTYSPYHRPTLLLPWKLVFPKLKERWIEVSNCSRMWAARLQWRMTISSLSMLTAIQELAKRNLWQLYTRNPRKLNHSASPLFYSARPLFHSPRLLFRRLLPLIFQSLSKLSKTVNYKPSRPFNA